MIYSIEKSEFITKIPHEKDFKKWSAPISFNDMKKIEAGLNSKIDGDEIHTAGWMPGHDWTGTVYEPIYLECNKDMKKAALLFGIIVFKVFMEREEVWGVGKYQKDGKDIGSNTYFKLNNIKQG